MTCKRPCLFAAVKAIKIAEKRTQNKRKTKYTLPNSSIGERQVMPDLESIGKTRTEVAIMQQAICAETAQEVYGNHVFSYKEKKRKTNKVQ